MFGVCRVCGEALQQYRVAVTGLDELQHNQQTGASFLLAVRSHFVEKHRELVVVPETMAAFQASSMYLSAVNVGPVSADLLAGAVASIARDAAAVRFDAIGGRFDASAMGPSETDQNSDTLKQA